MMQVGEVLPRDEFSPQFLLLKLEDFKETIEDSQVLTIVSSQNCLIKTLPDFATCHFLSPDDFLAMKNVLDDVMIVGEDMNHVLLHAQHLLDSRRVQGRIFSFVPSGFLPQKLIRPSCTYKLFRKNHPLLKLVNKQFHESVNHVDVELRELKTLVLPVEANPTGMMTFYGKLCGTKAIILMDSGATHSFIDLEYVKALRIPFTPLESQVSMANGHPSSTYGTISVHMQIQSFSKSITCFVTKLAHSVNCVLGNDWLIPNKVVLDFGTMLCHIRSGRKRVTLNPEFQKVSPKGKPLLSAMQLRKACRKGSTLFMVQVESIEEDVDSTTTWSSKDQENFSCPSVIQPLLKEYVDVFPNDLPPGLPPERGVKHTIPLEVGAKPPWRPIYRMSPLENEELKTQIADLLAKGWIEPSSSPYGAPVLFVPKKDGRLRMCVDYRALNKLTIKNRYALPRIDDILDKLQGAKVFTSLDLAQGYHQIRIPPEDAPKTAFRTPLGHFQYRVLSFGLTNAPATFQSTMSDMFRHLDAFVAIYLDDILIFSKTEEEHLIHVRKVLEVLRKNKFYAKKSKCSFMSDNLLYLGHVVDKEGVKVDPGKIAAVTTWPPPKDLQQLRSFLGFANYFRKFIQGYSQMVLPLTDLTRKSVHYAWTPKCQAAFDGVRMALTNAPTLVLADETKAFEVVTDASGFALGAVLLQNGRPIAFESRKMNAAERNYPVTEQELLAVVHALRTWRCYLEGAKGGVTVVTDHKPLTFLQDQQTLSRRQARWAEYLQRFSFKWEYRSGKTNIADPLSRQPHLSALQVPESTEAGCRVQQPVEVTAALTTTRPACLELGAHGHLFTVDVMGSTPSVAVPFQDSATFLNLVRECYESEKTFKKKLEAGLQRKMFRKSEGLYYRNEKLVVPPVPAITNLVLSEMHDSKYSGHKGVTKTYELVTRDFYWPGLRKDVEAYVATCATCQRSKPNPWKIPGKLQPLDVPMDKWCSVSMDLIVDLPRTKTGYDTIVTFVDRLTKMAHFAPTTTTVSAEELAWIFVERVWQHHGLPEDLVTDRDGRFISAFWREVMGLLGTNLSMSTAFHPQSDGQTERMNRVVEEYLRHYVGATPDSWDSLLPMAEYSINNTVQASTKYTPFFLNYGQHPRNPFQAPRLKPAGTVLGSPPDAEGAWLNIGVNSSGSPPGMSKAFVQTMAESIRRARLHINAAQDRQKAFVDAHRSEPSYAVHDRVLLSSKNLKLAALGKRKLWPKFIGPYAVVRRVGKVAYELDLPPNMKIHRVFHVSLLKPYKHSGRYQPPPLPIELEDNFEYEVERVLMHREIKYRKSTKLQYLIKWVGYGVEHNTWEPKENLTNCDELIKIYWDYMSKCAKSKAVPKGS
jgi:RNase H-like domain found in reverse transcriptase/Reverse transcriptase (RNA-dependent DNA polymerase)/Integrase zinc binding domain/Chromo (CHRromatin Organisation MOdifier) domain/Retroviral aspartyl protease